MHGNVLDSMLNPFDGHLMSTPELIVWLLACYGLTFLLCGAKLTAAPRRLLSRLAFFANLLSCYFCTGFWVSLALAYWVLQTPAWAVLHGFAGATFCYGLDVLLRRLEAEETGLLHEFHEPPTVD